MELFVGPLMTYNGKNTIIRRCSATRSVWDDNEVSLVVLCRVYSEFVLHCRDGEMFCCECQKKKRSYFFSEITENIYAGPLCLQCMSNLLGSMSRETGYLPEVPIYKVNASQEQKMRKVLQTHGVSLTGLECPEITQTVSSVRLF